MVLGFYDLKNWVRKFGGVGVVGFKFMFMRVGVLCGVCCYVLGIWIWE